MQCSSCGKPIEAGSRVCSQCGPAVGAHGNTTNTGGGDIHGGVFQATRDMVVQLPPEAPASASYAAVPKWRSPLTLGALSWLGLIVGLLGLLPLWEVGQWAVGTFAGGGGSPPGLQDAALWVAALVLLVLLLLLVLSLRRIAKRQLREPLILGWAVSGSGRRITFEKIRAGPCPRCGGKMRYRSRPTKWIDHLEPGGGVRREVTERAPALECQRNPKHLFWVDPAEDKES